MDIPSSIELEILRYLHLEFGESSEGSDALKLSELKYEGEFILENEPTRFWWFPCSQTQCWVIVRPYEDSYCMEMTTKSPKELKNA